jgi:hypothetical protein
MNDNANLLTNLNNNNLYDLRHTVPMLFENDKWPNPYLHVNIDSKFYDCDMLKNSFTNYQHPIFMSINIQSLMSKHENLKNYVLDLVQNNVPIYVIALQEIWNLQCTDLVSIPGFRFVYQPRRVGRGGGVGFYIREEVQFREMNVCEFVDSQFENIVIEATICKTKFILCNIYRAPSIQGKVSLRDLIEDYNVRLDNC